LDDDDDGPYEDTSDSIRRRSLSFDAAESLNQLSSNPNEQKTAQGIIRHFNGNREINNDTIQDLVRLNKQELRWLSLYHERPNFHDMEAAKRWMERVFDLVQSSKPSPGIDIGNSESEINNATANANIKPHAMNVTTDIVVEKETFTDSFDALVEASMKTISSANSGNDITLDRVLQQNDFNTSNNNGLAPGNFDSDSDKKIDSNSLNIPSATQNPSHPPIEVAQLLSIHDNFHQSDKPQTLADLIQRRKTMASNNIHKTLEHKDSGGGGGGTASVAAATEEEMSQTSSVVTRQSIRRRPSIQNARQLMGKIKLSGLNENEMDHIF
jgi:hypothetical protein